VLFVFLLCFACIVLIFWMFSPQKVKGEALVSLQQCQRVELIDHDSGEKVIGAEDIAFDPISETIYISAYNRRSVEKMVRKRSAQSIPYGGLYRLPIDVLHNNENKPIMVKSIIRGDEVSGGLRPHGLAYDQQTNQIVFVNRGFMRRDGEWAMVPKIERIGANGAIFMGSSMPASCSSNDLVINNATVLATFDHANCKWRAGFEDVFSLKRSGLENLSNGRVLFNRAGFANGITHIKDGKIAVAATREKSIHILMPNSTNQSGILSNDFSDPLKHENSISVPGGPDNLTIAPDGSLIAALHPSLLRMGLHRKLNIGRAPSRVVRIHPETRDIEILFNDPTGALFSAATVGVDVGELLILGSVTDSGLLVCLK